jgi:hypothetical protein
MFPLMKENGMGKGESGECWTHEILIEIVVCCGRWGILRKGGGMGHFVGELQE